MRELGVDRLDDDGRLLILRDTTTGEELAVRVDEASTVLGTTSADAEGSRANRRTETAMTSPSLSPREIQTRIRRGESADQVAEAAGVDPERIAGFAAPVLAEREYMAEQARKTTIRRRHTGGSAVTLGVAVDERLGELGVPADSVEWDAWRREDGRWTVVADVPAGDDTDGGAATFIFDHRSRYAVPADEAAHLLVGDVEQAPHADMALADATREQAAEVESPADESTSDDSIETTPGEVEIEVLVEEVRTEVQLDVGPQAPHASVRSLAEARDRRAQEQQALADAEAPAPEPDEQPGFDDLDLFSELEDRDRQDLAVNGPTEPRKRKHERRRVPSWDEIMFGGRDD